MKLPAAEALPPMARVRQVLPSEQIEDVFGEVKRCLDEAGLRQKLKRGQTVAITAGSRGMGNALDILRGVVAAVRECGAEPFLVPAMGSHGGATAEGQLAILAGYGITEEAVGCPIRATMETVVLGTAPNGAACHFDRYAYEAGATIVVGRCKTHPTLHEGNGSGVLKMTTVGLGKQAGAQEAHAHGLAESVQQVPRIAIEHGNIILGLNVVENGYRWTCHVAAVEPAEFWEADRRCLERARAHVARVPFERLDVLVVHYLGKNVSGAGMDPNVIGFWRAEGHGARTPEYSKIVVLDLTKETQGNALGIGQADLTTRRLLSKIDEHATFMNMLTASSGAARLTEAAVPMALATDREAISVALRAAAPDGMGRICWIKNTAELAEFWVSEALLPEVRQNPHLELLSDPQPWPFDEAGNIAWHWPDRFMPPV